MDYRCVIHRNLIIARGNPLPDNIFSDDICLVGISLESEIESFLSISSFISLFSNAIVSFSIYHLTCRGWHAVLAIYLCISCSCKIILWTCFLVFTSNSLHFQNRILEVFIRVANIEFKWFGQTSIRSFMLWYCQNPGWCFSSSWFLPRSRILEPHLHHSLAQTRNVGDPENESSLSKVNAVEKKIFLQKPPFKVLTIWVAVKLEICLETKD